MVRLVGHTLTSRPPRGLSARAPDNPKRPTARVPIVFVKVPSSKCGVSRVPPADNALGPSGSAPVSLPAQLGTGWRHKKHQ